ncbi:MAG: response regulator transcription factor [Lewinella sp.]|nr:response regulator transcription factor [Lewinella sp.]
MKVWIVEDEPAAARRLNKLLQETEPGIQILAQLDSIESIVDYLETHTLPDLIFMDIHLADGPCFELFRHVDIRKPIIFTTAYDQYAIEAFKVNAIDYLLKPIKVEFLRRALDKYREFTPSGTIDYRSLAKALQQDQATHRFLVRIGQRIRLVDVQDAAYFFTENKVTFVVTWDGSRLPLDVTMEKLEEILDERHFFRINRQYLIHFRSIKEMYAYSKSRVKLDLSPASPADIIVSTERSPHFKRWLVGDTEMKES